MDSDNTINDTYLTLAGMSRAELTVKASRFIGEALPVQSVDEALDAIEAIRKREYNASHHCFAYRLGFEAEDFRYSDDGEPNGTGGPPILRHIDGRGLTNVVVVVTRYYGGTNLGTGGLIRAYGDAAAAALDAGRSVTKILRERVSLTFQYDDTSPAMHTINQFNAPVVATNYSDVTEIIVNVRCAETDALEVLFTSALAGRGAVRRLDINE